MPEDTKLQHIPQPSEAAKLPQLPPLSIDTMTQVRNPPHPTHTQTHTPPTPSPPPIPIPSNIFHNQRDLDTGQKSPPPPTHTQNAYLDIYPNGLNSPGNYWHFWIPCVPNSSHNRDNNLIIYDRAICGQRISFFILI